MPLVQLGSRCMNDFESKGSISPDLGVDICVAVPRIPWTGTYEINH